MAPYQVKVSAKATPAIQSGQKRVSFSINMRYKKRFPDEEQAFPLVLYVPLHFVESPLSFANLLLPILARHRMILDLDERHDVALKMALPLVEEARKESERAGSGGVAMEVELEIVWEERMKFRERDPEDETGECVVCLEGLSSGAAKLIKTHCSHVFHETCIFTWLLKRDSCPLCRSKLT